MPRNSSGVYSLPSPENPVVAGTTILDTWANPTMNDIANELTDSLSRDGKGGMNAPIILVNGTAAAPSLVFASDPLSGLYRETGGFGIAALGATIATFLSTAFTFLKPLYAWTQADGVKLVARGFSTQTANILEVQNNAGTVLNGFGPTGALLVPAVGSRVLTSNTGAGTWAKPVAANFAGIHVVLTGGGGAGGGVPATSATETGAGSGGGAGSTMIGWIPAAQLAAGNHSFSVGAGGAGVSGADGNDGGTSTFSTGASAMSVEGGKGGKVGTVSTTVFGRDGGAGGQVVGNGAGVQRTICIGSGGGGSIAVVISGNTRQMAGKGGDSWWGGSVENGQGQGVAGICSGTGGAGSSNGFSATAKAGGSGAAGKIMIVEVYS
jgi:hypothetical protein